MDLQVGIVAENQDPSNRGRVRVDVASIVGGPIWAEVMVPIGTTTPQRPVVGATVWVMFEAGDESSPVVIGQRTAVGAITPAELASELGHESGRGSFTVDP